MGVGSLALTRRGSPGPRSRWPRAGAENTLLVRCMKRLILSLLLAALLDGCGGESPPDGGLNRDASLRDSGGGLLDAALDGGESDSGGSSVDLEGGAPLPPGRVACYFGPTYNCTREGEACCESNRTCYFPESEPEFCPP